MGHRLYMLMTALVLQRRTRRRAAEIIALRHASTSKLTEKNVFRHICNYSLADALFLIVSDFRVCVMVYFPKGTRTFSWRKLFSRHNLMQKI